FIIYFSFSTSLFYFSTSSGENIGEKWDFFVLNLEKIYWVSRHIFSGLHRVVLQSSTSLVLRMEATAFGNNSSRTHPIIQLLRSKEDYNKHHDLVVMKFQ
ncbi:MAG: hypothetical protein ACI8RD_009847, partial [Bacillariaceae sp.]